MTGVVTISLDFECGWGSVEDGKWRTREAAGVYRDLRPAMAAFIATLDRYQIPCTWACVGAMIQPAKARDLDHLRGSYGDKMRAFLAEAEAETMDGRDLLDMVQSAKVAHAFGSHSYSHMNFRDPDQSAEVAEVEMRRAAEANRAAGLDCDVLVFPRNLVNHLGAVADSGVRAVRLPPANAARPARFGPLGRALAAFTRPVSPVMEEVDATTGLVLHHGSEFLNWGHGAGRVKRLATRRRHDAALKAAAAGAHVHFWLHPFNLAETHGLQPYLDGVLARIAALRDAGRITLRTF